MNWSSLAMMACALILGIGVGRLSSAPGTPASAPASTSAESTAEKGKREGENPVYRKNDGFYYEGIEEQSLTAEADLDEISRMTLKLRERQPISFLGVPMLQIPSDNWLMNELIFELKPDYIIEAGTKWGGSALYYSALLEFINPRAKVISVDINEAQILPQAKRHPLWKKRVTFIKGSSTSDRVIEQIEKEVGKGKRVLVTLDTLHAPDHVRKELELYSPFVSRGSYIILQDTYYEGLPETLDAFLESNPGFSRDSKRDQRFLFSKYRGGFLKRQ